MGHGIISNRIKSMEDEPASVEPTTGQKTTKVSSIRFEIEFRALLINLYKKTEKRCSKKGLDDHVWLSMLFHKPRNVTCSRFDRRSMLHSG